LVLINKKCLNVLNHGHHLSNGIQLKEASGCVTLIYWLMSVSLISSVLLITCPPKVLWWSSIYSAQIFAKIVKSQDKTKSNLSATWCSCQRYPFVFQLLRVGFSHLKHKHLFYYILGLLLSQFN